MPIHDVGYRGWDEPKTSTWSRWQVIAENGFWLAFKSNWIKRLLIFSWLPVVTCGVIFFITNQWLERGGYDKVVPPPPANASALDLTQYEARNVRLQTQRQAFADRFQGRFRNIPGGEKIAEAIVSKSGNDLRRVLWSGLLMTFFRYPQAFMLLFLVGIIAPGLIANDIRSRAFLIYFSKPIGITQYIFGKAMTLVVFISLITTIPAIALYFFAVLLSPDLSVLWDTYDIPFRILLATFVLVIPTVTLALALSSLTQETRFARFAWFAIWALGHGAWSAIVGAVAASKDFDSDIDLMSDPEVQSWSILSLYNNLGDVQIWLFGFSDFEDAMIGTVGLSVVTIVSTVVLYRQIAKNTRT